MKYDKWLDDSRKRKYLRDFASGKITGAMVAWDEEKLVDLAIESALNVVDDWTFVIRGDETIAKVAECIKRFGLEDSYFLKEMEGPD